MQIKDMHTSYHPPTYVIKISENQSRIQMCITGQLIEKNTKGASA